MVAAPSIRALAKDIYVIRGTLRTEAARIERVKVTLQGRPIAPRDPAAARDAVAALHAERVVSLDKLDGAPDLVIDVAVAEGGSPRRIACRTVTAAERYCALEGVRATFAVAASRFTALLPARDAGDAANER